MITHSVCAVSLPSCSSSRSIPFHQTLFSRKHKSFSPISLITNCSQFNDLCVHSFTPTPATSCSKNHNSNDAEPDPSRNQRLFQQFYLSINSNNVPDQNSSTKKQNEDLGQEDQNRGVKKSKGLFTNMWWVNLKSAIGQRLNIEGIVSSAAVITKDRHLALPHVVVPDVRYIDWVELQRRGFKGVVFDKDNTITAPYSLTIWAPFKSSLEQCKTVFGHNVAVFSNSAGLYEYDHDGSKAKAMEGSIGIKVIRHRVKKPAGTAEEIEKHFGFTSSQLIMVGDRPFTDVVFGNRNGFLTILTEPFSVSRETFVVRQVRKLEMFLLNRWLKQGVRPISHHLLPDTKQCIKDL
uniref:Haloacid dehalogenase superfamily protein n=1 Tax=Cucumis melo TaxID=3656 RepID=A0A9I9D8R2_CUCME